MKIWILFSIYNDYNQPDYNMVMWWSSKPTFQKLARDLRCTIDAKRGNAFIGQLLKGYEVRVNYIKYRLREIEECKIMED